MDEDTNEVYMYSKHLRFQSMAYVILSLTIHHASPLQVYGDDDTMYIWVPYGQALSHYTYTKTIYY